MAEENKQETNPIPGGKGSPSVGEGEEKNMEEGIRPRGATEGADV